MLTMSPDTLSAMFPAVHDSQLARLKRAQRGEDRWNQRTQVYEPMRRRPDEHNTEWQLRNLLLMLEVPIHGQQGVELAGHPPEQFSVGNPTPAGLANRGRVDLNEVGNQVGGEVLIKKDAHQSAPTPWQAQVLQSLERG